MNNREEHSSLLYLLAGIGLGTLIGATLGLLFAPKPGAELRQDIYQKYQELAEKVKELSQQVKAKSEEAIRNVKERFAHEPEETPAEEA
ncbi:MAG: YtxH domain-containing protein [candidate division WOR-3 bacterium]